jgi:hypothetical protein
MHGPRRMLDAIVRAELESFIAKVFHADSPAQTPMRHLSAISHHLELCRLGSPGACRSMYAPHQGHEPKRDIRLCAPLENDDKAPCYVCRTKAATASGVPADRRERSKARSIPNIHR